LTAYESLGVYAARRVPIALYWRACWKLALPLLPMPR